MSMANPRLRRCFQLMGATGWSRFTWPRGRRGTIRLRCVKFGANTPWNRVRFNRGRGTSAANREVQGLKHQVDRPVTERLFVWVYDPPLAVDGPALRSNWRAGDRAAQAFQAAALVGLADTRSMP